MSTKPNYRGEAFKVADPHPPKTPGWMAAGGTQPLPPTEAFKQFVGMLHAYAPNYNINEHRPVDQLDFMKNIAQSGQPFPKNWHQQTPLGVLQKELAQSPVGKQYAARTVSGPPSSRDMFSLAVNAPNQIYQWITGGGPEQKIKVKDQTGAIVQSYMKKMADAGFSPEQSVHALASHWSADMKTLPDLKKIMQATYQYKMQQAVKPAPVMKEYIKNTLDPLEAANFQKRVQLYEEYSSYFARKQAGLKGKKLGTNPLTNYSRTFLGVPTGVPITPSMLHKALQDQVNAPEKRMFEDVNTQLTSQGYAGQVKRVLQDKVGIDQSTGKRTTAGIKELFNSGTIDLEDVLMAYIQVRQTLAGGTAGQGGAATPFKQAG